MKRYEQYRSKLEYTDDLIEHIIYERNNRYKKGSIYMRWSADDIYYCKLSIDEMRKNNWAVLVREKVGTKQVKRLNDDLSFSGEYNTIPKYEYKMVCNCSSKKIAEKIVEDKNELNKNNKIFKFFVSQNYGYKKGKIIDSILVY